MLTGHFSKWALDLKKHLKRTEFWLPHVKGLARTILPHRVPRYLTLCAQEMIDVFLLVHEQILSYSADHGVIEHVRFCELDAEIFPTITELIGVEDSGFPGRLEDLALFEDDAYSVGYPDLDAISTEFEEVGEALDEGKHNKLTAKRRHLLFRTSFPYDLINLDFCERYYMDQPGMLRINETVGRMLEWQRQPLYDASEVTEFLLFVTCRQDDKLPADAVDRLKSIARTNAAVSPEYRAGLESRGLGNIDHWARTDIDDFFFSVWPKEIGALAADRGWAMTILSYPYYDREGDHDNRYKIACLVLRFQRADSASHLTTAVYALDPRNRSEIQDVALGSAAGRDLLTNLQTVVELRNRQAHLKMRPILAFP